jgi:two-component system cell cycle sensor histidine kinase/response regulator CckA
VEDEDSLRMVACTVLRQRGYNVLESSDPLMAIEKAKKYEGQIDLLLSDVIMPHMKGPEMAKKLESIHPEMHVLFMSGYTGSAISQNGILEEGANLLQKPFRPNSLLKRIRQALKEPSPLKTNKPG